MKKVYLREILGRLLEIEERLDNIMVSIDDLIAKVTAQKTVVDSIVTLLAQIKAQLTAAGTDPVKLQTLSDSLDTNTKEITDAVVANT